MRKLLVLSIAAIVLLSACSRNDTSEKDFMNTYNSFVDSILDNNGSESKDIPFTHSINVVKESSGEYRYEITIDNPKVAMYNIQMMVVDKNSKSEYPFIGLLPEDDVYSMIPFQENKDKSFVKGILLSGISTNSKFTLNVQVSWKDYAQVNTHTVFFNYVYDYEKEHVGETSEILEQGTEGSSEE